MILLKGDVGRNPVTWKQRYDHLNSSFHNYLRISRILKALGEFGFERFKVKWVEFLITEALENKVLPNTISSLQRFWVATLRRKDERIPLKNRIRSLLEDEESTDDEGDDMGLNPDMIDIPSPPLLATPTTTTSHLIIEDDLDCTSNSHSDENDENDVDNI